MHRTHLDTSYCIMSCCKSRNTRNCACRGICIMTPNNEIFDLFNRIISIIYMISQQLIIQCDVCSVLFSYQTNRNISSTKSNMEKLWWIFFFHFKSSCKYDKLNFRIHFMYTLTEAICHKQQPSSIYKIQLLCCSHDRCVTNSTRYL